MWGQWNSGIRGPFADARLAGDNTLSRFLYVRLKDITDGTSKTILLGEGVVGTLTNDVKSGLAVNVGILPHTPASTCSAKAGSGGLTGTVNTTAGRGLGHRWGDCRDVYTNLYTKIPPNGVSCSDTSDSEATTAVAASSWHPGGVNMAMCDGTVKFFAETVDAGDATAVPPWPSGAVVAYPSFNGVWGALRSIQGGQFRANSD